MSVSYEEMLLFINQSSLKTQNGLSLLSQIDVLNGNNYNNVSIPDFNKLYQDNSSVPDLNFTTPGPPACPVGLPVPEPVPVPPDVVKNYTYIGNRRTVPPVEVAFKVKLIFV